jgi:DNA-binding response OmpR family regulator
MKAFESRELRSGAIRPEQPIGSPALAQGDLKGKTLLVVEDEAVLREFEVQVLGSSGCRVLEAGCVAEALRVIAATAHIHLLLTDFSLPDGNGFDLAHRFRVRYPRAAVILVSGSVAELDGRANGLEHLVMMEKPFKFNELLRMVRALLADTAPAGGRITPPATHGKMRNPLHSG